MRSILTTPRNVDHVRFNLTLIRHAETSANANGIIQGSIDTELSEIGYLQAKAVGHHLQYQHFSHIYSSDLKRASETTRQIHLLNRVSSCEIKFDHLLRERTYGIAEGHTRQWLRELAKENGVPYINFTPEGAETPSQVRDRVITFFRKLSQELLIEYDILNISSKNNSLNDLCNKNFFVNEQYSSSMIDLDVELKEYVNTTKLSRLSIDSAVDVSSLSSDQRSLSSSSSIFSRKSSFEKHRKYLFPSPYENDFADLEILVVSHGAVIREFIKYFACDLQTDMGEHLNQIQELPGNTSITRFHVIYSPTKPTVELVDFHNKTHLITNEYNLDVVNKCSL